MGVQLGWGTPPRTTRTPFHDGSSRGADTVSGGRHPRFATHPHASAEPDLLLSDVPHELHGQLKNEKRLMKGNGEAGDQSTVY